jgi:hypothetical protein
MSTNQTAPENPAAAGPHGAWTLCFSTLLPLYPANVEAGCLSSSQCAELKFCPLTIEEKQSINLRIPIKLKPRETAVKP